MAQFHTSGLLQADGLIKSGMTRVRAVTLSWIGGAAAGICTLIDGTTVAGHDEVVMVTDAAQGTIHLYFGEEGKLFETGVFFNVGIAMIGTLWCSVDYR